MKKALIFGGTGLTGTNVAMELLDDKRYGHVILLVRKPLDFIHHKLSQVVVNLDTPVREPFEGVDDVFCCFDNSLKNSKSKLALQKNEHEKLIAWVKMAHEQGVKKLAIMSTNSVKATGSSFKKQSNNDFESIISKIGFDSCIFFKPTSVICNANKPNLANHIKTGLIAIVSTFLPASLKPINSLSVAEAMLKAINDEKFTGRHIFGSARIRMLAP